MWRTVLFACFTFIVLAQSCRPTVAEQQPTSNPSLVIRAGEMAWSSSGAASPDGQWFVTQSYDGTLTVRSAEDGKEFRSFRPFGQQQAMVYPHRLAITADSKTIVFGSFNQIFLVDVQTAAVRTLPNESGSEAIAAHPTRPLVATVNWRGLLRIVSLEDAPSLFQVDVPAPASGDTDTGGWQLNFSPDGKLLAVAGPLVFQLWDWEKHKKLMELDAHRFHTAGPAKQSGAPELKLDRFVGTCFSPDGSAIALLSSDEITLLSTRDGKQIARRDMPNHWLSWVLFTSARTLAIGEKSLAPLLWSLDGGDPLPIASIPDAMALVPLPGRAQFLCIPVGNWEKPSILQMPDLKQVRNFASPVHVPDMMNWPRLGPDLLGLWFNPNLPVIDWNMESGEAAARSGNANNTFTSATNNGRVVRYDGSKVEVDDAASGSALAAIALKETAFIHWAISANGKVLAGTRDEEVDLYSLGNSQKIASISVPGRKQFAMVPALSPAGDMLALATAETTFVYSVEATPRALMRMPKKVNYVLGVEFSPDGKFLVVHDADFALYSTRDWKHVGSLEGFAGDCVTFSPSSDRIAYRIPNGMRIAELPSLKTVIETGESAGACPAVFSPDGRWFAAAFAHGINLFRLETGEQVASLYFFGDDDWLVVTSSGLFDGTPGAWSQLAWRFSDSTFDLAPIEVFFREFFRPGLLHDLLAGRDVEPPSPIAAIDRRQPQVILKSTVDLATPQIVPQVQLEVQVSESRVPAPNLPHGSGARDLRLFRNGTLIKVWRGDLPLDMNGFASFSITVPIVAGENTFTAYAFSQANIKSPDATLTATGADTLQRLGTAYVLAIGINTYDADSSKQPMNLNFAENDARDFEDAFAASQNALHQFASVQTISLLSRQATRENILAALRILGGASTDSVTPAQRSLLRNIAAVRPEDGVFLFYAGHGAMEGEHFYLLPTDVDPSVPLTSAGFHAISEIELGQALENIAPKRSFLIIDACHSGAAIDVKNVGPMNSVGLAQLAYEKGLYILAASQDRESALEAPQLAGGHGYLTFALVEEGLKTSDAVSNGTVELRPWFEYASHRVPDLQTTLTLAARKEGRALVSVNDSAAPVDLSRQHPRVFYRREPETSPFIVAKPQAQ